jgi:hypothetical protein
MKKVKKLVSVGFYAGLVTCALLSKSVEAEPVRLQKNGSEISFEILSRGETTARVGFTLATQSGKIANLSVSLNQGEAVEYFLEQIARHEKIDFFTQCPDITPSVPISKIRIEWPFQAGLIIVATNLENESSRFSESGGQFSQVSDVKSDDDIQIVYGTDEDYSHSECFPQASGEGDTSVPSEFGSIVLDAQECALAYKSACFEPLVVNQLVTVLSDGGGRENQRTLTREIQGKRRLLARALKSKDVAKINKAARAVRRLLSVDLPKTKSEIMPVGRGKRILRLLGIKGMGRYSALYKAVELLKS